MLAFIASEVWYLSWRAGSFNPDALIFSVLMNTAEVFGFGCALLSIFIGLRYTDTDLSPDDVNASARGSQVGIKVDLQREREIATGWRGNLILSYTGEQRAYWTRAATRAATGASNWATVSSLLPGRA